MGLQEAKVTKPSIGALDVLEAGVTSRSPAILVRFLVVLPVGHYQLDASLFTFFAQQVEDVAAIDDYRPRLCGLLCGLFRG